MLGFSGFGLLPETYQGPCLLGDSGSPPCPLLICRGDIHVSGLFYVLACSSSSILGL